MINLLSKLTPKHLITLLITLILVVGEARYGVVGGFPKLAMTLGTCVAAEVLLSLFLLGRLPMFLSAYITGTSLTILLRPQAGIVWPFVVGALISIGSKYVLRYRGRHLWNPSNFGIAILSHEFGNDLAGNAVIWVVGLLVASRARVLHVSITYVTSFLVLALLRSAIVGTAVMTEIAPLTGPMYQLMVFFMLTDPPTTPSTRGRRMVTVASIAVLEALFRLGNDFNVPGAALFAPAPPILALAIIGPIALALDLRGKGRVRPAATSAPAAVAAPA